MEKEPKEPSVEEIGSHQEELMDRRDFLLGLKKWSKVVIGVAVLGSGLLHAGTENEAVAGRWANARGGGGAWGNHGGGGGAWGNRAGGGGAWANGRGGGGGAWVNGAGGGGGAWVNRGAGWINGGGGWINRF